MLQNNPDDATSDVNHMSEQTQCKYAVSEQTQSEYAMERRASTPTKLGVSNTEVQKPGTPLAHGLKNAPVHPSIRASACPNPTQPPAHPVQLCASTGRVEAPLHTAPLNWSKPDNVDASQWTLWTKRVVELKRRKQVDKLLKLSVADLKQLGNSEGFTVNEMSGISKRELVELVMRKASKEAIQNAQEWAEAQAEFNRSEGQAQAQVWALPDL